MTTTMIQQWGNSKAVRIPKQLASELGFAIGRRWNWPKAMAKWSSVPHAAEAGINWPTC